VEKNNWNPRSNKVYSVTLMVGSIQGFFQLIAMFLYTLPFITFNFDLRKQ